MKRLSIIIAYHNEGELFIQNTIDSINATIDIPIEQYEIIVIDDYSDVPLIETKSIRQKLNKGVGFAFDTGVRVAKSNNLFLMGCDVRFTNNNWASKMITEIENNPKSLICTSVVPLQRNMPELDIDSAKKYLKYDLYRGAFIKYFIQDGDKRDILEASWMPREFLPLRRIDYIAPIKSYEVPCILGAAYGVSKKWYNYIDGFWGHKFWGTLEPLISIKSYLFGGNCLVVPHIETAHIFNEPGKSGGHGNEQKYTLYKQYNRMLISWLLFPSIQREMLIGFLRDTEAVIMAKEMIKSDMWLIIKKRDEYIAKTVIPITEIMNKSIL